MNVESKKRGRPCGPKQKPETMRLPVELVERIERYIAQRRPAEGFTVIRAEAIRHLLSIGLDLEGID